MNLSAFRESLAGSSPPSGLSLLLQALWWEAKGDWDKAHAYAQGETGAAASAVHAYLHRKEPDPANARYWYARAGRAPFAGDFAREWEVLVRECGVAGD